MTIASRVLACPLAAFALSAMPTQASTIASENFETGAAGWSNNRTEDPGPNSGGFSTHLGRFGAGEVSSKTFALSGNQTTVNVAFDFYRIDTWDGETFFVDVSDSIQTVTFAFGPNFFFDGPQNFVYNRADVTDRNSRLSLDFGTTDSSFTVLFRSSLDQGLQDEAWGVDNLLITDNVIGGPGGVPEPSAWALLIIGFGAVGAGMRTRRRAVAIA